MTDMKLEFAHLSAEKDRHGNDRLYVRRNGRRIRIRETPGTSAFARVYAAALEALALPAVGDEDGRAAALSSPKGTLGWLAAKYFASVEFKALDPKSQITRRSVIEGCLAEPRSDDDPDPMRNCPIPFVSSKKIKRLRDLKVGLPGAANNRKKYLSAMFGWAIEADHMKSNPARDVRRKKYATNGFYTWTLADLTTYENRHPVGSKARLALSLLLYLGVRKGDVVRLGPGNVHDRVVLDDNGAAVTTKVVKFTPNKTRYKRTAESEKPLLPILADMIAASPTGAATFLETELGLPFTAGGFGNKMREWCDQAKLPMCTSHGLRKIGATLCAEKGATEHQLMAIFDWTTPSQAAIYTRSASRQRLAASSMHMLGSTGGVH